LTKYSGEDHEQTSRNERCRPCAAVCPRCEQPCAEARRDQDQEQEQEQEQEQSMTENMETDPFNLSLRQFLKQVGVTSQRAIEQTVAKRRLRGGGKLTVRALITAEGTDLQHVVEGEIDLG
jgi:hypothetical protein